MHCTRSTLLSIALGAVGCAVCLETHAEEPADASPRVRRIEAQPPRPAEQPPMPETPPEKTLYEQAVATQEQLVAIQDQALEESESLQQMQAALEALARKKINAQLEGTTFEQERKTLDALGQRIRAADSGGEDTSAMIQQYQAKVQTLQDAQAAVSQDEAIQSAQEAFRDELLEAMQAQDPATQELLEELQRLQVQFQRQQMQQQMQQQDAPAESGE